MLKLLSIYLSGSVMAGIFAVTATFFLTHFVSPAEYGKGMLFLSSFWILFFLCSPGMNQVLMRYFYEPKYRDRTALLLYRCLLFVAINTALIAGVLFFCRPWLAQLFGFKGVLTWLLLMVGAIVTILLNFAGLIPRLFQKPSLYVAGQTLNPCIFLVSILIFLLLRQSNAMAIIISQLIAMMVTLVVLIYCYKSVWTPPRQLLSHLEPAEIKQFISYGFPFILSSGLDWVFFNLDKFLLLKWSNYYELGVYTAAFVLSSPLDTCKSIFTTAWIPRCNQLLVEMPFKGKKIFHDTFHRSLWVFTAVALLLLSLKSILVLFLGKEFREAATIFGWLLLAPYFFGLAEIVVAGILKSKKTYWNIVVSLLSVCTNIVVCYYLIPIWGAQGAAIASAASFAVFFAARYLIAFQYYSFKIIRWKLVLYVLYLCGTIEMANHQDIYLSIVSVIVFLLGSLWLEPWLYAYYRGLIGKLGVKVK